MIVGRGGGSMEDLWAFNEEAVAQAVFDCRIPVISAVGHETDTTITDFVADLRAPTPSAAAELAVCDVRQLLAFLKETGEGLNRRMQNRLTLHRLRCRHAQERLRRLSPAGRLREKRMYAMHLEERIRAGMDRRLTEDRHRLALYTERMRGLSPLEKLGQGFSRVLDSDGKTVSDVNRVRPGDPLTICVKNGIIRARAEGTEKWQHP